VACKAGGSAVEMIPSPGKRGEAQEASPFAPGRKTSPTTSP